MVVLKDIFGKTLREFIDIDTLSGADLSYMDLEYADFRDMDLTDTDFHGSSLKEACFDDAVLDGADFTDTCYEPKRSRVGAGGGSGGVRGY